MKRHLLGVLLLLSSTVWAQQSTSITEAMDNYNYKTAINLIDQQSPTPQLLFLKAKALKGLYQYAEATDLLQTIITDLPNNSQVIMELAECSRQAGRFNVAIENYEKLLKLNPNHTYAQIQYLNLLLMINKYSKAKTVCENALARDSSTVFIRMMAQCHEGLLEILSARDWYIKVIEKEPDDYFSVSKLANIYIQTNDYAYAIDVTEKYREKDPDNIYINRQNAQAYCLSQEHDMAVERYTQLLNQGDSTRYTCYYAGVSFFAKDRFFDAHDCLEVALKYDPQNVSILFYLAKACARTSWKNQAIEYMQQALDITIPANETVGSLYGGMVDCAKRASNWGKYMEALHLQRKYAPTNYLIYMIGAGYQDYMKDEKNAIKYLEMYLKTKPKEANNDPTMEGGALVLDANATYRIAESRLKKLKEERFFRDGVKEEDIKK
ncbi:tetratricopeptide repeat protein [Bacteroides sp. 519]|uniref:tetratricopeptide repeat protein n=1 Tax=Bacteroides sp. 519 TaxID=2302937 RepID=UPI0013D61D52|nr:tetratricopeptide repeat protein [Bacteroides sp. 519]NDV59841.1 hypothetical protein [Bacteroides sp. 519]